jgi:uncharacterized membrane protein
MKNLRTYYRSVLNSIAFLPSVISLIFVLFSLLVLYLELSWVGSVYFTGPLEVLMVKGNDNARQILSTLIGGMISLTVFSFSMVMVLLNQASSSFTPRIVPGILTDKKNQFVLGFYLGTIIYCLIIILNVKPGETHQDSPKVGVLLAMFLGICCLGLFIYFIHLISLRLQVGNIISSAAKRVRQQIQKEKSAHRESQTKPGVNVWYSLSSQESGYLSEINEKRLEKMCSQHHIQIELLYSLGTFLYENEAICKVSIDMSDQKKLGRAILSCFILTFEPYGKGTYLYGLNQISEIAVKALSPGTNDPVTALIALDHLSLLFNDILREKSAPLSNTKPGNLLLRHHNLEALLLEFIRPISHYGKEDPKVRERLAAFYDRLHKNCDPSDRRAVCQQREQLLLR